LTQEAFKSCFDQYFDAIRNYIYYRSGNAELATDIAQDVFLKVWEKQLDIQQPQRTQKLLYQMAKNKFIDYIRKQKVSQKYLQSLTFNLKANSTENHLNYQELKKQYETTLKELPDKQRTVFLMNRMEGLTYKQIALRLDLSVKTIEKRMSKTLKCLRKTIQT